MLQNKDVLAQYEANQTPGRGQFDPRKGIYKIISTYQGTCYGKPAQMATANWRDSLNDSYSDEVFTIQLESFKVGCDPLDTTNIIGREINVSSTTWFPEFPLFIIKYDVIISTSEKLKIMNTMFVESGYKLNVAALLEEPSEDDLNEDLNDLGDY
ncbi:hypothetical protein GCM10011387_15990 [Pedobacter quisquiliarum]|uniref:Uncharacterized protein n=1 Tax=Pedobacter quisquiliarum TaxID=1834438 RepID=A0A916U8M2_9SPHI|nr:hypothetical protein [Pedobacter quisquiliarum]GGC63189.1 hypothetical protein GCM10011387_15990 [Pedobacter quisquiliarum]